jgi:hypothetical protein
MTKANGDKVGHVLYDGYRAVLASTVPATLTTTLAGSGDVPHPDTGLVYLGAGRWYDPALGRPLQPDPIGGPPALPQALNRYAATPWGPPGVAEGAASDGFLLRLALSTRNQIPGTLAGLAIDQITITSVERQIVKRAVPTAWGLVELVHPPTTGFAGLVTRLTQSEVGRSLTGLPLVGNRIAAYYAGRNVRSVQRALLGEAVEGGFAAGEGVAIGHGSMRLLAREVTYVDEIVASQVVKKLGSRLTLGLTTGASGIFSFGFQYLSDYGNPYLTGGQRLRRATISGFVGTSAALTGGIVGFYLGGPVGFGVGLVIGIVGDLWLAPLIFEFRGDIPHRNVAPLSP